MKTLLADGLESQLTIHVRFEVAYFSEVYHFHQSAPFRSFNNLSQYLNIL